MNQGKAVAWQEVSMRRLSKWVWNRLLVSNSSIDHSRWSCPKKNYRCSNWVAMALRPRVNRPQHRSRLRMLNGNNVHHVNAVRHWPRIYAVTGVRRRWFSPRMLDPSKCRYRRATARRRRIRPTRIVKNRGRRVKFDSVSVSIRKSLPSNRSMRTKSLECYSRVFPRRNCTEWLIWMKIFDWKSKRQWIFSRHIVHVKPRKTLQPISRMNVSWRVKRLW